MDNLKYKVQDFGDEHKAKGLDFEFRNKRLYAILKNGKVLVQKGLLKSTGRVLQE